MINESTKGTKAERVKYKSQQACTVITLAEVDIRFVGAMTPSQCLNIKASSRYNSTSPDAI